MPITGTATINFDGNRAQEVAIKVKLSWSAFGWLNIIQSKMPLSLERKKFDLKIDMVNTSS